MKVYFYTMIRLPNLRVEIRSDSFDRCSIKCSGVLENNTLPLGSQNVCSNGLSLKIGEIPSIEGTSSNNFSLDLSYVDGRNKGEIALKYINGEVYVSDNAEYNKFKNLVINGACFNQIKVVANIIHEEVKPTLLQKIKSFFN